MQFPIGSTVKLAMWTGDDQIDYYHGQVLTVTEFRLIPVLASNMPITYEPPIPNYSLLAPDSVVITANEYELEAA